MSDAEMDDCWTLDIEMHGDACKNNASQGYKYLIHTRDDVCRVNTVEDVLNIIREALTV